MNKPPNKKKIIPASNGEKKVLTISNAAKFLNVNRGTIYNMINDGRLELKSIAGIKFVIIE